MRFKRDDPTGLSHTNAAEKDKKADIAPDVHERIAVLQDCASECGIPRLPCPERRQMGSDLPVPRIDEQPKAFRRRGDPYMIAEIRVRARCQPRQIANLVQDRSMELGVVPNTL